MRSKGVCWIQEWTKTRTASLKTKKDYECSREEKKEGLYAWDAAGHALPRHSLSVLVTETLSLKGPYNHPVSPKP
jgi:hypothetical protein